MLLFRVVMAKRMRLADRRSSGAALHEPPRSTRWLQMPLLVQASPFSGAPA
jgi:hypothetical protein